jgi:DNA helicase II / ATP-dependent DNA helicase PcrA
LDKFHLTFVTYMDFDEEPFYIKGLNDAQKSAVLQLNGPVMIIAGAGSGKTKVLTHRIVHKLSKGVDAFNILSLTFTNKAAKEMRHRIEAIIGSDAKNLWMGTFHSIFAKILRIEADRLGYPSNFTIYDSDDSKSVVKAIIKDFNLDDKIYKPNVVSNRISNAKNNLITAKYYSQNIDLINYDQVSGRGKIVDIYLEYEKRCFKAGAMDFDDLLLKTYQLFHQHVDILNKYQQKFHYVLVDEFQDTNHCQYMIVKKLASVRENICVVGDDAQSIYSFRGATIKNILNFEADYPDLKTFRLEQNYRSTDNIVKAANSLIAKNREQLQKNVWTHNPEGEKIKIIRGVTDNDEGRIIAQGIFTAKMNTQSNNKDFAILYRTNSQSRSLEEALRKLNIPYRVYGGMSFYQRKEIKDVLAYLRFIVNPQDDESLKRIINLPARGIGGTTMQKLAVIAMNEGWTFWQVLQDQASMNALGATAKKLADFVQLILGFQKLMVNNNAYETAMNVVKITGLLKMYHEDKTVEGISRYENIAELLNGIKEFSEDDTSESEKGLGNYLQDISLLTNADENDGDDDKVALMTIHQSKGLEFPYVYISGMEENLFPSQMSLSNRSDLEEERRLFYVAITRAEKELTLSFANTRFKFGNLLPTEPSRFLKEIDPIFLEVYFHESGTQGIKHSYSDGTKSSSIPTYKKLQPKPFQYRTHSSQGANNLESFVGVAIESLIVGQWVEHQRFGVGELLTIEGQGDNKKGTVLFENFGEKTLILKFAKLKIVEKK